MLITVFKQSIDLKSFSSKLMLNSDQYLQGCRKLLRARGATSHEKGILFFKRPKQKEKSKGTCILLMQFEMQTQTNQCRHNEFQVNSSSYKIDVNNVSR